MFNPFGEKKTFTEFKHFVNVIAITFLSIALSVSILSNFYFATKQRIIMQPPFILDESVEMDYTKGKLKRKTFTDFAEKWVAYTENLTPANAKKQTKKVYQYIHKDYYGFTKILEARVKRLEANNVVRNYHIGEIDVNKFGTIFIKGAISKVSGDTLIQKPTKRDIKITYNLSISNGFEITNVEYLR